MNGIGNDYIFIDTDCEPITNKADFSRTACLRHIGIGGDGVVFYHRAVAADVAMEIYNPDGSKAELCGNALRCLVKLFGDKNSVKNVSVATECGIKHGTIADLVSVEVCSENIRPTYLRLPCESGYLEGYFVPVGNPHFVRFAPYDAREAEALSRHPQFPRRTNVEYAEKTSDGFSVRVYERGCGETLACGTGAVAVTVASGVSDAVIRLPGGDLLCERSHGQIVLTGPVAYNYIGEYIPK